MISYSVVIRLCLSCGGHKDVDVILRSDYPLVDAFIKKAAWKVALENNPELASKNTRAILISVEEI